jgi:hypothetical protein
LAMGIEVTEVQLHGYPKHCQTTRNIGWRWWRLAYDMFRGCATIFAKKNDYAIIYWRKNEHKDGMCYFSIRLYWRSAWTWSRFLQYPIDTIHRRCSNYGPSLYTFFRIEGKKSKEWLQLHFIDLSRPTNSRQLPSPTLPCPHQLLVAHPRPSTLVGSAILHDLASIRSPSLCSPTPAATSRSLLLHTDKVRRTPPLKVESMAGRRGRGC